MNKEFIDIATKWIIDKLVTEGASIKVLEEGIFTTEALWGDIINYTQQRGLEEEILDEFLKIDEILIEEIKSTIIKFLRRELPKSFEEKVKQDKQEENNTKWD